MTHQRQELLEALAHEERALVKQLGQRIGYGRMIQLAEELWGEMLPGNLSPATHARRRLERYDERESLVQTAMKARAPIHAMAALKRIREYEKDHPE